jgi:DNA modification methylase
MDGIRDAIREVGWAGALLYNERTKRLIDGHARKKLFAGNGEVPVLIGSWTEDQEKKILATLDPLASLAEANTDILDNLLREIDTGSEALQNLLASLRQQNWLDGPQPGLSDPDNIPEPPDEPISKPGDLWLLGKHRLLCGDSSKPEDVDRLLDGATIQLVNTDPPYGVKVEPRSNNAIAAGLSSFAGPKHHQKFDVKRYPEKSKPTTKKLRAKDRPLASDFLSDDAFAQLLAAWFGNLAQVLEAGRAWYVWGGYSNLGNFPPAFKAAGLYFSQAIVWDKGWPVLTRKDFMGAFEIAYYGWKEGAAHQFFGPTNVTDLWHIKKITPQAMQHLTEKPVELATRAMAYSSRPGENVLDLFGGSGSTLIAAEQMDRRAFLLELDPLYVDVIVTRWEQFTGKKARLAHGKTTRREKAR